MPQLKYIAAVVLAVVLAAFVGALLKILYLGRRR